MITSRAFCLKQLPPLNERLEHVEACWYDVSRGDVDPGEGCWKWIQQVHGHSLGWPNRCGAVLVFQGFPWNKMKWNPITNPLNHQHPSVQAGKDGGLFKAFETV